MNEFYPAIEPYHSFNLDVGDEHRIYVEQCGNPEGVPVLFVHGGPGSGCSLNDRRFFNPKAYRIILFDQRGCGRSSPHGSLKNNETSCLVSDIEKIRKNLNIEKWHIFGGSWGSTLSLVYAQSYPNRVKSMVLRGIFLGREQDAHWTFNNGGACRIFPDHWHQYLEALPKGTDATLENAYNILTGDNKEDALKLARAWSKWEMRCCTLEPDDEFVASNTGDGRYWTVARHEAHFIVNNCFLTPNQILTNCDSIAHIPTIIVHGRYDIVCPFDNAWALHQHLPKSELIVSKTSGHSSKETETKHHLIEATSRMLTIE